jgi:hypothetical protein
MTFYSEPSPALVEVIGRLAGQVEFTQFSFFQGLEAEAKVPDPVPA